LGRGIYKLIAKWALGGEGNLSLKNTMDPPPP